MSRSDASHDVPARVAEAIQTLRSKGVLFWMKDGALCYRARQGLVTDDDREILRLADCALVSPLLNTGRSSRFEPHNLPRLHRMRAPLAFSQLNHWNVRERSGHRPIRQLASVTSFRGRFDIGALEEALSVMMDRHEALRTRIVDVEGTLMQEVRERSRRPLEVIDLSDIPPMKRPHAIQQQISHVIKDITDYARDPLFLPVVLRIGEDESVLILATDHMISDGASLFLLLDELLIAQAQLESGRPVSLPAVGMQFSDYALWQRTELTEWLRTQGHGWERWPRTRFPDDPPAEEQPGWGTVPFALDACSKRALQDSARHHGTSQVMLALTAYVALILRWCEVSEALVQVISDGRMSMELQKTIGYLAFPHYLHVSIDRGATFLELLHMILKDYCRACEQPDFYYSYVREPRPEFTRSTGFNWLPRRENSDGSPLLAGSEYLRHSSVPYENPLFQTLELDAEPYVLLTENATDIGGEVGFPRKRFSVGNMARFAANYGRILDALMNEPASRICDAAMK